MRPMENSGRIKKDAWLPSPGWADAAAMPVYCSFFSRYSFIASFTMSFSDMFFLMARNFIRVANT